MSSELSNLRNQAKLLQKEKESCQSRIAALEFDITNLMKQRQFSPVEISDYFTNQQQIADLQDRVKRAEAESMELRSMLASQSSSLLSTMNVDNSACQSIIESNNKYTMEITQKMAEKQKLLSETLLENASLKKSISLSEAENAKLTSELHALKWQIENSTSQTEVNSSKNSKSPQKSEVREFTEITEGISKNEEAEILKKDAIIQELQTKLVEKDKQLDVANQAITKLQTTIVTPKENIFSPNSLKSFNSFNISEYSQEIEQHREELKRAKIEIKRLTKKNEESDAKISYYEKRLKEVQQENLIRMQSMSQMSDEVPPIYHNDRAKSISFTNADFANADERLKNEIRNVKAICASLRDQNESLKEENTHLRVKANDYKEAFEKEHAKNMRPSALRDEVFRLRDEIKNIKIDSKTKFKLTPNRQNPHNQIYCSSMKKNYEIQIKQALIRYASDLSLKFDFFQTKMQTALDKLEIKFERFETYWNQILLFHKRSFHQYSLGNQNRITQEEFINALKREIKTIKALSYDYAQSQNIPKERIPPPFKLIGDKNALKHFILNESSDHEKSHSHKHH